MERCSVAKCILYILILPEIDSAVWLSIKGGADVRSRFIFPPSIAPTLFGDTLQLPTMKRSELGNETYQAACKNRQLWSTTIKDTVQTADCITQVASCICCVRPVLKDDIGTRRLEMKNFFGDMLNLCSSEKSHMIFNAQCCILRDGVKTNEVFVCYICQPSWKKSVSQYHTPGQVVDIPYTFMVISDNYMKNVEKKNDRTDKLSLLKYILCCSSHVNIVKAGVVVETIYHPLRTPDYGLLEQSILFFEYIFEYYCFNVREFNMCPFEMVNIADWHLAGFPLLMFNKKKSQDLRKAIRGSVGIHYCEMNNLSKNLELMHINHPAADLCAACYEARRHAEKTGNGYDSFFLPAWTKIRDKLEHGVLFRMTKKKVNFILCKHSNDMSVVSFKYYREISKKFPRHFRQRNRQRYYARLIQSCEAADASKCTDERQENVSGSADAATGEIGSDGEDTMEEEIRNAMQECCDDTGGEDESADQDEDTSLGLSPLSEIAEASADRLVSTDTSADKTILNFDATNEFNRVDQGSDSERESMQSGSSYPSWGDTDSENEVRNLKIDEQSDDDTHNINPCGSYQASTAPTNFDTVTGANLLMSLKRKNRD